MAGRFIAIGDVHGCWHELEDLLERLAPTRDDTILFVGDLVNRGPDSGRVLDIALHLHAHSLLGNHEQRLLSYRRLGDADILKDYDHATLARMRPEHWDYLARMRLTWHAPEHEIVFVHGGFLPHLPWHQQTVSVVTRIQVVTADRQPAKRNEAPGCPHWSTLWRGPPFVVYGHTPRRALQRTAWTLGLDTGCVYGGALSAFVLPASEVISVPARRTWVSKSLS